MKHFFLPLFVLLVVGSTTAQIEYESPHVKDGKSMQFTLPSGYFRVANGSFDGYSMYASEEGLDMEVDEIESLPIGMIVVMHVEVEGKTLETLLSEFTTEMVDGNEGVIIVGEPEIKKVKGRNCIYAGLKGEIDEESVEGIYFSVIEFGDYFIVLTYYALDQVRGLMEYKDFKKIMTTCNEIATDREDGLPISVIDSEEIMVQEAMEAIDDLKTDYQNDLFGTVITYNDVLPDADENWKEPSDDTGHLLSKYQYKEGNGSVKIFSGGMINDYPSTKEMARAIQLVLDLPTQLELKPDSGFTNEDHVFKLYSISGGGTATSVYTTLVENELVFFIVDGGSNPVPDFKPAVRDFMLTMWVDVTGR